MKELTEVVDVHHCTIHNALTHPPAIDVQIQTPAMVAAPQA